MMRVVDPDCRLMERGHTQGSCLVEDEDARGQACRMTLQEEAGKLRRLVASQHLSRPEHYFSIYQSGCNISCQKCHSWYFSKNVRGEWYSPEDILESCENYQNVVNYIEPRERATSWHAHDLCRSCGLCVNSDKKADWCPGVLSSEQVISSPQGFGPARNIVAFTGGDLTCRPEWYARCAQSIRSNTNLWVLIETNGYGLIHEHLDYLREAGVDAFWLDIKAYDPDAHKWLTGVGNESILKLPEEMRKRDFVVEVLSLYIPGVVEEDQIVQIARLLVEVDRDIPFTILAYFPEHQMRSYRPPVLDEMLQTYKKVKDQGLNQVRLANTGVFAYTRYDFNRLRREVGAGNY